jgi:sugar transferase (PEP-CTERM/EpsH1 system associated)
LREVPAFIDVVDVDSQKWYDFADAVPVPKKWLYRFEASRIRKVERELPNWANTITLVSDAERDSFNTITGQSCAVTATNGVDLQYFVSCDAETSRSRVRTLAFIGAMDYLPNIDAVIWFAKNVWPALLAAHPGIEFRIIGRNPAPSVKALAGSGIRVTGNVPDVRECLKDVPIVIAPMRLGRGLQNKVLEALAMGKAVIASPPTLVALKAEPDRDLLLAETPEQWIAAVSQLLRDSARCRELGAFGRRFVEENHDWEACLKPLIDRVLSAGHVEVPA